MARISVRKNSDGTITVRVGKAIEHVDPRFKEKGQAFDCVKYALISKGASFEDISVAEMLWQNQ